MLKAVEIEDLQVGHKVIVDMNGYSIVEVIEKTDEDVIITGGFDLYPNEDGHYFVTNYYELES